MGRERLLSQELGDLMQAEESYYKHKSRIDWLSEGDQNTRYFQKIVAANHSRSSIRCLIDANGNKLYSFSQISNEAVSFFQNLIGTKDDSHWLYSRTLKNDYSNCSPFGCCLRYK